MMLRRAASPEDDYSDNNFPEEVDATLTNIDNELDDAKHALSEWPSRSGHHSAPSYWGSFYPHRAHTPTFYSATGAFTYTAGGSPYSGTGYTGYTGSTSFVTLPTTNTSTAVPGTPRSPPNPIDLRIRPSRNMERTEESPPTYSLLKQQHVAPVLPIASGSANMFQSATNLVFNGGTFNNIAQESSGA